MPIRDTVAIPRELVERAVTKARLLYIEACERDGDDIGHDTECWAEFEDLQDYLDIKEDSE